MFYVWKFKRNQNICQGLSKEYLEIDIEMSYVMFSAACPPALLVGILIISPFKILRRKKLWILNLLEKKFIFLALGKNLVETRFDAKKLLLQHRFYSTLFKRLSMCFSIWQMIHNSFILTVFTFLLQLCKSDIYVYSSKSCSVSYVLHKRIF